MKNKEIEELLNIFKELINTYSSDTEPFTIDYDYEIKYSALENLLSYIEQLEKEKEKITKSRDFHLRFNKSLMNRVDEYKKEKEQLENNRDKAIELLGNYKHYSTPTEEQNRENEDIVDNAYNILKGDSDD